MYNPLNRLVESDLLPVLRKNNCSFVAYNPLAAGLLTGRHQSAPAADTSAASTVLPGRFKNNPNYLPRFYTDANFEGVELIRVACEKHGISMVEATYCWLLCHSALKVEPHDGVLLGASSMAQLEQNLNACWRVTNNPVGETVLAPDVLSAFDEAWKITSATAFPYWRSYSKDMPKGLERDQGASYNAASSAARTGAK